MPRRPSIEAISAVSSPQTNAPAPSHDSSRKPKPLPRMSLAEAARAPRPARSPRACAAPPAGTRRGCRRYPRCAPTAYGGDGQPFDHAVRDTTSSIMRSMNAPGSPSSPLQMTYFGAPAAWRASGPLARRWGSPPPPRPRRPAADDRVDDLLGRRCRSRQRSRSAAIAVAGAGIVEVQRVDPAAVLEHDAPLLAEDRPRRCSSRLERRREAPVRRCAVVAERGRGPCERADAAASARSAADDAPRRLRRSFTWAQMAAIGRRRTTSTSGSGGTCRRSRRS